MRKSTMAAALMATFVSSAVFGSTLSMEWKGRNSKIICGGVVNGQELDMKVSVANEVMKAESGRILVFVDVHQEGQVRWVMSDSMTDEEYDAREAILAKLSEQEKALIRTISSSRQTDLHTGLTKDGYVHIMQTMGDKNFTLSCQELKN